MHTVKSTLHELQDNGPNYNLQIYLNRICNCSTYIIWFISGSGKSSGLVVKMCNKIVSSESH